MRLVYSNRGHRLLMVTAIACSIPWCGSVFAQDVSRTETLEEVTVTAQRRVENLQKVPIAATVMSGADLIEQGVTGLTSLQYAAPALTVSDYGSANVLNIRGIGRSQVDIELPSGVVIYRDGFPTFPGYFQNEPYFDIRSIEVLRGPQGTFVGKSAAGGAIFVRTNNPELGELGGSFTGGIGNFDQYEGTLVLNAPVGDTLAFRLAYNHLQRDHYYDSITGDYTGDPGTRDLNSLRLGALWQPNDNLEVLFKTDLSELDFGGNAVSSYGTPAFHIVNNVNFEYEDRTARLVLDLKYHFDNGLTLSSLSGHQYARTVNNFDRNGNQPAIDMFNSSGVFKLYSQEFNLISPDEGRLTWVIGTFAQRTDQEIFSWRHDPPGFVFIGAGNLGGFVQGEDYPYFGLETPYFQREDEVAAFVHVKYDLNEKWEVEVGARYSHYDLENRVDIVFGDGLTPPSIPFLQADRGLNQSNFDAKVALNYTPAPEHFIYALVATGHITPGFNIANLVPFDEQKVVDYELGWKADWLGGRVRTQLGGYYQTFDKYQAAFQGVGTLFGIPALRNALGESRVYGFEGGVQARLGGWEIDFGFSTLDSRLGRYPDVLSPFLPAPNNVIDVTGAQTPFAPDLTANIGVGYTVNAGSLSITPRVDFGYTGEQHAGLIDAPQVRLVSRSLTNAKVRIDSGASWWADLYMTNVADKRYVFAVQESGNINYAGPPRQYGVRFGMDF